MLPSWIRGTYCLLSLCFVSQFIIVVEADDGHDSDVKMKSVDDVKVSKSTQNQGPQMETMKLENTLIDANEDVKIEQIKLDPKVNKFSTYQSPELKRQQVFKHYNNTYMYVSFRQKFLDQNQNTVQQLYQTAVHDYLTNAQSVEGKLKGIDLTKLTLEETLDSHVVFKVGDLQDQQKIANNLKLRKEILAIEWLDKKKLFGDKASLDEMKTFKTRVKRQQIVYDPDVEREKEEARRKKEAEDRKIQLEREEAAKNQAAKERKEKKEKDDEEEQNHEQIEL